MQTTTRVRNFKRSEPIDCSGWLWLHVLSLDRRRVRIRFETVVDVADFAGDVDDQADQEDPPPCVPP
ncbi:MAG: hypothetical protein KDA44_09370 [Planctomycetales bacterium]|nr:hypothetical protein [Planctomycetales bacterium]